MQREHQESEYTTREITRQAGVRRMSILKKEDATGYRSACMRLSYLAQQTPDFAGTATDLAQRMSEPREFDFFH